MIIISVNHQPVRLLIQPINTCYQPLLEILVEMFCIDQQIPILAQEIQTGRIGPAFGFVNGIHSDPFVGLCLIDDDLRPEGFVHLIQRHAPVGLYNEFLFQPQFLLEVLDLSEEILSSPSLLISV